MFGQPGGFRQISGLDREHGVNWHRIGTGGASDWPYYIPLSAFSMIAAARSSGLNRCP
jgi:hypothetical protein